MRHVVIGTAGHVDHGKTWLTRALTGTDTDRLKEERERGITIDIGFAQLKLPDGRSAGIVDVPGHERLIKNMLAGATGIDIALLVVAADEGFMPQTVEHLEILQLLGVRHGIVVLTKVDLVEREWLEVVREDVAEHVAGTFLEGAPVVAVSAKTGEGIEELKELISRAVAKDEDSRVDLPARLPVDRVFTVRGHGTVVTGSLIDGRVKTGDTLMAYPQLKTVRVRELQNHDVTVDSVEAGMRVAMNLTGMERKELERGCTLAAPGTLAQGRCVSVRLQLTSDAPFLVRNTSQLHFYAGTQELVCRVRLLDADVLEAGESGFAQLTFEQPLAARNLDHFVVRFLSPMVTVGGGVVLDMGAHREKRRSEDVLSRLSVLAGPLEGRVRQLAEDAGCACPSQEDLVGASACSPVDLSATVDVLVRAGSLVHMGPGLVAPSALERTRSLAQKLVRKYHAERGLEEGMRLSELRERLASGLPGRPGPRAVEALVSWLGSSGTLETRGDCVALPGFQPSYAPEQERIAARVRKELAASGLEARSPDELAQAASCDARTLAGVLARLARDDEIVSLTPEAFVSRVACDEALGVFTDMFDDAETVTLGDFRTRVGVSRKYAQLLLDHFDHLRISKLVGDARVLLRREGS
ncbi:selenocysteine-specific translation elongation factor [Thermophilibacter immobilis]|uniref:Selenocysteine-specific elongation factor n=1 Tax=Thermophilibacter immobilis TaxID=2779519 RepID=A0A7S7M7P3_9ACTN|nr:selenocysteine-specific translation elongation factor [Thermophilibacter immobilis]QOY60224.1 selenocysteine-specific translation elongation factor [Thermophilibacter immobilis]